MEKPDDKGFLSRWSARKAEARSKDAAEPVVAPVQPADEPQEVAELPALPSIDDLTEHSDYTLFLRKGVPDALRKAALRKLWVTEPSVVNYRPLVEYAWHNNEPGFGPLLPTDNVEDMLNRIFGGTPEAPKEPDEVAGTADAETADRSALSAPETAAETPVETGLPVEESAGEPVADLSRRRHGGALPT